MSGRDYQAAFGGKRPSAEFTIAVNALGALQNPETAVGYFLAQQRDQRLAKEGYVFGTSSSIRRLVGKRAVPSTKTNDPDAMPNKPPGDDHGNLYFKDGKPAFYLSEPYKITYETLQKVVAFCERWGLEATIDGSQSTWFPSLTIAIKYTAREGGPITARQASRG